MSKKIAQKNNSQQSPLQEMLPIIVAAHMGDLAAITLMIEEGFDVNQQNKDGITALYAAAFKDQLEVVLTLLEVSEIDVNASTINGHTPLYVSCEKGYELVAKALMKHKKINVNAAILDGTTPLSVAIFNDQTSLVLELLKSSEINVNAKSTINQLSPLHYAAFKGNEEIIKLLITKGAEINAQTKQKQTPIAAAIYNNKLGAVKILLENGAKFDVKDFCNDEKVSEEMKKFLQSIF